VFDYEKDIENCEVGWGVTLSRPRATICYKKDVLGIALRYNTGQTESVNTLKTYKSMYE
jgi:hypothetical protein